MLIPLLCVSLLSALAYADVLSLSKLEWTLQNQLGTVQASAEVPSQVHLDLFRAGVITEPLLGINDFAQRWIVTDNWIYTADLTPVLNSTLAVEGFRTLLVFYGLDTVATISIAGHPLTWVNNQFQQYVFDVTDMVASPLHNDTTVSVAFESAFVYGQNVTHRPDAEQMLTIDFEWPGVREYIRKISSDFGWDWGPAFVPAGIFKPAYLVTLSNSSTTASDPSTHPLLVSKSSSIFIEESALEISKARQSPNARPDESADWLVNVTLALRSIHADANPTLTVSIPELHFTSEPLKLNPIPADTDAPTTVSAAFTVPNDLPQRWYPHNLGTGPKLYNITITLSLTGSQQVSYVTRSGFRTIFLAQTAYADADVTQRGITPGDQWHFEVNGKAFYSLGSNVIPFDPFYARITTEQVRWVLESAVKSGQNMLRVWGGGIYQPSDELTGGYDFYSICDELGILVWSELGFSDSTYPVNDWYLVSVEREVRQNVRRIKRHPSNAQWAGGNEIEPGILLVNSTLPGGVPTYVHKFLSLFQDFLHDIVMQEQSSVAYTDCSTTNGVLSLEPYQLRLNNMTAGHLYGNAELYNYDSSQSFNYSTYPISRFVNEFGFHSMPSFYSWEEVLESPGDFSFNSTVVMSRDHNPPPLGLTWPNPFSSIGQGEMTNAVEQWLPTPFTSNTNQTFAQWCYSTQVFQALYMTSEIAWYRRGAGRGENNLGSLVWQLNDIWQGVSWSAIEHSGRWKVLNYALAKVYSPLFIHPFWTPDTETLEVVVTSDRWETVAGTAQLTWYDWTGNVLNSSAYTFSVPTLNSSVVYEAQGLHNILPVGHNASDVWMLANLTAQVDGTTVIHEQYFTPTSLAASKLVDPKIKMTSEPELTFTLSATGGVSAFTWLDHPARTVGYFVDKSSGLPWNGFYLVPGQDRTVQFVTNTDLSRVHNPDVTDFVVRSLWNNTHV